jgi:hypothetical protein
VVAFGLVSRPRFASRLLALALLLPAALAVPWGCGARTPLPVPTLPSSAFCGRSTYDSGFGTLSIYLLLDKSLSMNDDGKWDDVTAAIAAFVDDPLADGMGMGLQFFPNGCVFDSDCTDARYAVPAVPVRPLPGNAAAIKAALAAQTPAGDTPTLPAMRAAIEYARASLLADPTRQMVVVLATDGDPDSCDSNAANVSAEAAAAAAADPQVLTAVIGIEHGNAAAL